MQFLIDTATESRAGLLLAANVLLAYAAGMEAGEADEVEGIEAAGRQPVRPIKVPTPPAIVTPKAPPAPAVPLPPNNVPPAPIVHPEVHPDALPKVDDVPAGTDLDPAKVFGGNVVPLVPPPPAATVAAAVVANVAAAPAAETGTTQPQTSATAAPPASVVGDQRDSAGLPWDERIHSETKKTNADGTWRYRRNLDANVKASVTAELKAQYGQQVIPSQSVIAIANALPLPASAAAVPPPPPAATTLPAASVVPPPPPAENIRYDGDTATVIPQPPVSAAVPVPPAPALGVPNANTAGVVQAGPVTSFRDLMNKVNGALAAGRLTQPQLLEACKASGVESVSALAAQPMLVPAIDGYLNRWLVAA